MRSSPQPPQTPQNERCNEQRGSNLNPHRRVSLFAPFSSDQQPKASLQDGTSKRNTISFIPRSNSTENVNNESVDMIIASEPKEYSRWGSLVSVEDKDICISHRSKCALTKCTSAPVTSKERKKSVTFPKEQSSDTNSEISEDDNENDGDVSFHDNYLQSIQSRRQCMISMYQSWATNTSYSYISSQKKAKEMPIVEPLTISGTNKIHRTNPFLNQHQSQSDDDDPLEHLNLQSDAIDSRHSVWEPNNFESSQFQDHKPNTSAFRHGLQRCATLIGVVVMLALMINWSIPFNGSTRSTPSISTSLVDTVDTNLGQSKPPLSTPLHLAFLCRQDRFSQRLRDRQACFQACHPAACCFFEADTEGSCRGAIDETTCQSYLAPCKQIFTVDEVPIEDKNTTEDLVLLENHNIIWEDVQNEKHIMFDEIVQKEELITGSEVQKEKSEQGIGSSAALGEDFLEKCDGEMVLSNPDLWEFCLNICEPGRCCVEYGGCWMEHEQECEEYLNRCFLVWEV